MAAHTANLIAPFSPFISLHQEIRFETGICEQGYEELRRGACEGMKEDGLLRLAFSNGLATPEEHALAAIESYLNGVKKHSEDLLHSFPSP